MVQLRDEKAKVAAAIRAEVERVTHTLENDVRVASSRVASPLYFRSCGTSPTTAPGNTTDPSPRSVRPVTTAWGFSTTSGPSATSGPTTAKGPISTRSPITAPGSTTAMGWMRAVAAMVTAVSPDAGRSWP